MMDLIDLKEEIESFEEFENVGPIDKIRLAQELVKVAVDLAQDAADELDDRSAQAYIVDRLKILAGRDHGFMSNDTNFDEWIEKVGSSK